MKNSKKYVLGILLSTLIIYSVPSFSLASTFNYQPRTQAEMVAFMYGRISQLLEIKQILEQGGGSCSAIGLVANNKLIQTHSAADIEANKAILRGEIIITDNNRLTTWFEYGEERDFLDLRTRKVVASSIYDRAVRTPVTNLKDDTRYYYRMVAMNNTGSVQYGEIYQFRTKEK